MTDSLNDHLIRKLKTLNDTVWEQRAPWPKVEQWLSNFAPPVAGDQYSEHLHALYLLGRFMYFGDLEMRELLRSLFRDIYKYPIVAELRRANADTKDYDLLDALFQQELYCTRFLGIGNPSESGTHLLYHFRQENTLPTELFINTHQIFSRNLSGTRSLRSSDVRRYIFIDDLAASGQQASEYSTDLVEEMKSLCPSCEVVYLTLFATSTALSVIRKTTAFDRVDAVMELDPSFKVFGIDSRYFPDDDTILSKSFAEQLCRRYGVRLNPAHPLGYRDSQLLIGFRHNIPDNTLPIIWSTGPTPPWTPIFRRYQKL
jgi:hypothetical protein